MLCLVPGSGVMAWRKQKKQKKKNQRLPNLADILKKILTKLSVLQITRNLSYSEHNMTLSQL